MDSIFIRSVRLFLGNMCIMAALYLVPTSLHTLMAPAARNVLNSLRDNQEPLFALEKRTVLVDPLYNTFYTRPFAKTHPYTLSFFAERFSRCHQTLQQLINASVIETLLYEAAVLVDGYRVAIKELPAETDKAILKQQAAAVYEALDAISFQEHRFGGGLQASYSFGQWQIQARSWIGMTGRNAWVSMSQLDTLLARFRPYIMSGGTGSAPDIWQFISYHTGIGDTKIDIARHYTWGETGSGYLGLCGTLPTAWQEPYETTHTFFDLKTVINGLDDPASNNGVDEFANSFVARLRDFLLYASTGNNGHFGIGANAGIVQKSTSGDITLRLDTTLEYFFRAQEVRFCWRKKDTITKKLRYDASHAQYAHVLHASLLPEAKMCYVCPPFIVTMRAQAEYNTPYGSLTAGMQAHMPLGSEKTSFVSFSDTQNVQLPPAFTASPSYRLFMGTNTEWGFSVNKEPRTASHIALKAPHSSWFSLLSDVIVRAQITGFMSVSSQSLAEAWGLSIGLNILC